jgi:hypothetical protein
MAPIPNPERASFLSTAVVSRALGLDPVAVRAMIENGTLPEPQWITSGSKVERVYSLEWLMLAGEQLNLRRLPGLEYLFGSGRMVHFAVRFERTDWTLDEVSRKLNALVGLWSLCARTLSPDDVADVPALNVRRLSAGSPLDLLAWADHDWGGLLGTGGVAALFIYIVKNPTKIAEAIPRVITSWRENWAKADDAAVNRLKAKINRKQFEKDAKRLLKDLDAVPSDTALSGAGTSRLELLSLDDAMPGSIVAPKETKGLPRPDPNESG